MGQSSCDGEGGDKRRDLRHVLEAEPGALAH